MTKGGCSSKHGCLIEINEYFCLLLENYIKTNKWKRVY